VPDVHLDTDEVDFVIGTDSQRRPCEILLKVGSRLRLSIRVSGLNPWAAFAAFGEGSMFSLHMVKANVDCEAFLTASNGGVVEFSPSSEPIVVGCSEDLASVRFDLINFPKFLALYGPSASRMFDHLDISAAGWAIEIRPPRQSRDLEAFQSSMYSVTHSCMMRRGDGGRFTSDQAEDVLNAMHEALSLAAGRWVSPAFVAGTERSGRVVWKLWGTGRLVPELSTEGTWFDPHHAGALGDVISGLFELQKSADRSEAFRSALYWYVRSSPDAAGVDGGLILLQAALERLAWQRVAVDGGGLTSVEFRKRKAGERLRLLLQDCGIPTDVPSELTELASEANRRGWDGPWALVACRDLLVHPEKLQVLPWYDLWTLSRWYVELVLLKMLGFSGEYSNRTRGRRWVGTVEPVPWA